MTGRENVVMDGAGLDLLAESMYISLKYHAMKMINIPILAITCDFLHPPGLSGS